MVNLRSSFQDNGCSSSDSRNCRPLPNHCGPSVEGTAAGPPSEKTPNKEIVPTMKVVSIILANLFCLVVHLFMTYEGVLDILGANCRVGWLQKSM
jgi:hypothetical protein